jgi:hypothetical protein
MNDRKSASGYVFSMSGSPVGGRAGIKHVELCQWLQPNMLHYRVQHSKQLVAERNERASPRRMQFCDSNQQDSQAAVSMPKNLQGNVLLKYAQQKRCIRYYYKVV